MQYTADFVEQNFPKENIVYLPTIENTLRAVNDGRADVAYVARDCVSALIDSAETYDLEIGAVSAYSELIASAHDPTAIWNYGTFSTRKLITLTLAGCAICSINTARLPRRSINFRSFVYHNPLKVICFFAFLILALGAYIYRRKINQKNFEMVRHMAYTDPRYDLPNVAWLEMKIPDEFKRLKENNPDV
ncbi:MAG: hypothetical protein J5809_09060 [Selenomonadaceae bacterium]|nr:hypothetical protein [Selenomonadaceae bacterium]